jgi:hypothetical protein
MERFYQLHAYVCEKCLLVQLGGYVSPEEIFGEYAEDPTRAEGATSFSS